MFKLVISDDEGKTTVVPLVRDEITIGRKEGNTIRLTERNVSRRHARLRKHNGHFFIEDLNSYNGVKINGRRIEGEIQVGKGDQVSIGDYILALQSEAGAEDAAPGAAPGAQPQTPPRLVMLTPPAPGAEFALTRNGMRIGRAEDLDVWVNHRSISREHAEVQVDGDLIKVVDLGSANGVRLNGEDVTEALLGSGDVLELGQVRFRFVGAGEHYQFEADRTIAMDAIPMDDSGPSRAPIFAAVAIVIIAIGVGAAIAFTSEDPNINNQVVIQGQGGQDPDPIPQAPTPEEQAQEQIESCRQLVTDGDLVGAVAAADLALQYSPGSEDALQCKHDAQSRVDERGQFETAAALANQGQWVQAHEAFSALPDDSPFRDDPLVDQAFHHWAAAELDRGRLALDEGDPTEAQTVATALIDSGRLTALEERAAEELRRDAAAALAPEPGRMMIGRVRMPMDRPMDTVMEPVVVMMEAAMMRESPRAVVQRCRYSQPCIIENLRGRTDSAQVLGILAEAYAATGQDAQKRRTISQLQRLYPTSSVARMYR